MKRICRFSTVLCLITALLLSVFSTLSTNTYQSCRHTVKATEKIDCHDCAKSALTEREFFKDTHEVIDGNSAHVSIPAVSAAASRAVQKIHATDTSIITRITAQIRYRLLSTGLP